MKSLFSRSLNYFKRVWHEDAEEKSSSKDSRAPIEIKVNRVKTLKKPQNVKDKIEVFDTLNPWAEETKNDKVKNKIEPEKIENNLITSYDKEIELQAVNGTDEDDFNKIVKAITDTIKSKVDKNKRKIGHVSFHNVDYQPKILINQGFDFYFNTPGPGPDLLNIRDFSLFYIADKLAAFFNEPENKIDYPILPNHHFGFVLIDKNTKQEIHSFSLANIVVYKENYSPESIEFILPILNPKIVIGRNIEELKKSLKSPEYIYNKQYITVHDANIGKKHFEIELIDGAKKIKIKYVGSSADKDFAKFNFLSDNTSFERDKFYELALPAQVRQGKSYNEPYYIFELIKID